jgi:hypothetical protein
MPLKQVHKINKRSKKPTTKNHKTTMNTCNNIIKHSEKWKYTNMNPEAPHMHGTIKLHKQNKLVRPIVNWNNSPGY